jgi:group I intron endonuclease
VTSSGNQGIYAISGPGGQRYIGSSTRLKRRLRDHKRALSRGIHHCSHLQRAWDRHGEPQFTFEIVELVEERSSLLDREQHWLDQTPDRYNSSPTAASPLGFKQTEEAKQKIRIALTGKSKSVEHVAALSASLTIRMRGETEMKAKFARNRLGTKQTPEQIAKRVEATRRSRSRHTPEQRLEIAAKRSATIGGKTVGDILG